MSKIAGKGKKQRVQLQKRNYLQRACSFLLLCLWSGCALLMPVFAESVSGTEAPNIISQHETSQQSDMPEQSLLSDENGKVSDTDTAKNNESISQEQTDLQSDMTGQDLLPDEDGKVSDTDAGNTNESISQEQTEQSGRLIAVIIAAIIAVAIILLVILLIPKHPPKEKK